MSPSAEPLFPPRSERGYDAAAVETFPWPVIAGYEDVHRWMDQGQAVHAAWQIRDVWEGLIKFLGTLAVADHLASAPAEDSRIGRLLALLLNDRGLSLGHWKDMMEIALKSGPLPQARVPELSLLLFPGGKPGPLFRLLDGDKDTFIPWRNSCFGHGVFRKNLESYAEDALRWLRRLHEAFELCRAMLESLELESEGPNGEILTWGQQSPLPFYHAHQSAPTGPRLPPVRVRSSGSDAVLLTPLLSVQHCNVCGQWAAFYLDRYEPAKHRAKFLDFIEGHTNQHKNLEPLRRWTERISEADARAAAARQLDAGEQWEPDPERFRDFQREFEPPVYLARAMADFLQARDRGVLALMGPGGVGKSWVTLGLDHAGMLPAVLGRDVPLLGVSMQGPKAPRASEVWTALAERARRVKSWQVPPWPDGPEPHTRFAAWLTALMHANALGELLVALDGLDDLPADSDVPDLWPPAGQLPQGCYLLLSNRPAVRAAAESGLGRVRSMPDYFGELRIGPDEPEHRAVLRSYVAKRLARRRPGGQGALPKAWAEPLIDQAGGSFLYVFHFCRALHFGVYAELAQLPPPAAYYPAFFEHLRGRVGNDLFEGHYGRTLALIAVAREPVGLAHLTAWGLDRSRLIVMLDDLADLLRSRREPWDAESLFSLGHDAIWQFLTEDPAWQSRLADADRFLAELAVQRFGNDWSAVDPFDPVESYLLFHLLDHARHPQVQERVLSDAALAEACLKHGITLSDKGEFASSLLAYDMAVRLREDQVQRQGRRKLRNHLASAYMQRGIALRHLRRLEEALADDDACIRLREELVEREGRRERRNDLALAYMNRGVALRDLGRLEEAVSAFDDCIRIREQLVHQEEAAQVAGSLAVAYLNRGVPLMDLGRLEEAVAGYDACIPLYEQLIHQQGQRELRRELALAHMNRAVALNGLGRLEEEQAACDASIALYEQLVHREGRRELRPDLARASRHRAIALDHQGRLEEALVDYAASIELYEQLVHHEGRRELRDELASAYSDRGGNLFDLGRLNEALADFGAAIGLREELIHRQGRRELRALLARAYMNRGNALADLDRREEALAAHNTAIGLYKDLVQREGRSELRDGLATAFMNRGATLGRLDQPENAMTDFTAAIDLLAELMKLEGHREVRHDLAMLHMNRGMALKNLRRLEEALADYGTSIGLLEALVHREGRRELAGRLGWAHSGHSRLLLRLGRRQEACQQAREAISILQSELTRTGWAILRSELESAEEVARNACD
jgi:tetratricopeptide (TPR) repeat protein